MLFHWSVRCVAPEFVGRVRDYGDYLDEVRALKEWATRPVRRPGKHPLVGIHVSLSVEATVWEYTDAELSSLTQPIFEREYIDAELLARMQPSFELDPPERATASSAPLQNLLYYQSVLACRTEIAFVSRNYIIAGARGTWPEFRHSSAFHRVRLARPLSQCACAHLGGADCGTFIHATAC